MREQLMKTTSMARGNLLKYQAKPKEWYDRSARKRSFAPGDEVRCCCQPQRTNGWQSGKALTRSNKMRTNASDLCVGAALLQGKPNRLQPVLYISRKLNKHEFRYSVVEKECLAFKWALDSLRYYLLGRKFILETDHRVLSWLQNMRDTNSRITQWFLAMQPFDFDFLYRKGNDNCTADYLSRKPQLSSPEGGVNVMKLAHDL
ncbi:hypothetical protein F2P81_009396 [Scophthalmus maximus]|uniref:Reverse transcriptase RNase H-like domain-containing protein n=1 Tax=Scophthalmus maximus TaxID=52904 RepID=A0A6A4T9T4_SCOMX|nr:hypothetical protein F2P81_009396 [Scophthalmus maximus]